MSYTSLVLPSEIRFTFGARVLGIARSWINSAYLVVLLWEEREHLKNNQGQESLSFELD